MRTPVTIRFLTCALVAALLLSNASPLRAEFFSKAYARASGRSVDLIDEDSEALPIAFVAGSAAGASFQASASVSIESGGIALHAYASAEAPAVITEETFLSKAGAEARVSWFDDLRLTDFEALPLGFVEAVADRGLQVTVYPNITGNLSGRNAAYYLSVSINRAEFENEAIDAENGRLFRSYEERIGGVVTEELLGNVPVGLIYPNLGPVQTLVLNISMELSVRVNSQPGTGLPGSGPSEADFSHTVLLGPLVVSDANGNYIPGSEYLKFVGSSGVVYNVRPIPEPASVITGLIGVATLAALVTRKRRC